jgi:uncharacterized protein with NRDE domain
MCLIAFAWQHHPRWRLVLLGNRDEFHARPTASLAMWPDAPGVRAGRDLEAGGTWAGLSSDGRVAAITNVRDPLASHDGQSRGWLVSDFLASSVPADTHAHALMQTASTFRPFNLLTFDTHAAFYTGNHPAPRLQPVPPGIHGLSNADFNAPWPKTTALMQSLGAALDGGNEPSVDRLFDLLANPAPWPDDVLPDTGIGIERERFLSSAFIAGEHYGTRASTVILVQHDGQASIHERRFGPHGAFLGQTDL